MKASILRPSPQRVVIRNPQLESQHVLRLAEQLTDIAGSRFDEQSLQMEFPHSTWHLPDVQRFFAYHDLRVPSQIINNVPGIWNSSKRPLYDHQLSAVEFLVDRGGGLLADAVGCGKSASALAAAETYMQQCARNKWAPRVVIGPKFLRKVWLNEHAALGLPGPFYILEGRDSEREGMWRADGLYYFVHYDVVAAWWSHLTSLQPGVVIVDEAHLCKNPMTQRYKGVEMATMGAPLRLILTGTPVLNKISESWTLLNLACGKWSWGTKKQYRQRYSSAVAYDGGGLIDGPPSHMDEFQLRLSQCMIRRTVDEVGLNLPAIMRSTLDCDLDEYDRAELRDCLKGYTAEQVVDALHESRLSKSTIEWITRIRKATSHVKLPFTIAEISSFLDQGESVVCFTWLKESAERIVEALQRRFPEDTRSGIITAVTGDYELSYREHMVDWFQRDGGAIVATYDSLGVGVTLTKARVVVMHDIEWVPAKMIQAEGRVYRISQNRNVISKLVVAPGTLDERLAEVFIEKADIIAQAIGDTDPLSFADLLKESGKDPVDHVQEMLAQWRS